MLPARHRAFAETELTRRLCGGQSHKFPLHGELGAFSDWWASGADPDAAPLGVRTVSDMPSVAVESEPGDLVRLSPKSISDDCR